MLKDYNMGNNGDGSSCPYYFPKYDDWTTCKNCGKSIKEHTLFCPYNHTHKVMFESFESLTTDKMLTNIRKPISIKQDIGTFLEYNNLDDFNEKIKR